MDRRDAMLGGTFDVQRLALAGLQERVDARLRAWRELQFSRRLWAKDFTLWSPRPVPEIADRLGWLALPRTMVAHLDDLLAFASEVKAAGMRHVVLLGMGGSSLAPEVFQHTFGSAADHPRLIVLDSTHPDAVRAVESRIDPRQTLFVVSSKSGTTTETLSFFRYFWECMGQVSQRRGEHFAAITDPNTPLVALAGQRGFRRTFLAPADVGGRYSALTVFGLVPAALIGADVRRVLEHARRMAEANAFRDSSSDGPGFVLGAALGELALAGRDKVTFLASPSLQALPSWIEQLIAESTGKDGKGIIPVVDEAPGAVESYGADRFFVSLCLEGDEPNAVRELEGRVAALEATGHPIVRISLQEKADLGQEYFRWEVAVASAGSVLGIQPFNQPDVQLAKELAQQAMAQGAEPRTPPGSGARAEDLQEVSAGRLEELGPAVRAWMAGAHSGDYVGVQAYLAPADATTAALQAIRVALRDRLHAATTVGYGPRFLHSSGQLHKGGPNTGLFLQIVDEPASDLAVPETAYTFGALIHAQALGDLRALHQRGRRVMRVNLGRDIAGGLRRVVEALDARA